MLTLTQQRLTNADLTEHVIIDYLHYYCPSSPNINQPLSNI